MPAAPATKKSLCKLHGPYEALHLAGLNGHSLWSGCPRCADEAETASRRDEQFRLDRALRAELASRGISGRLLGMTFETYQCDEGVQQHRAFIATRVYAAAPAGDLLLLGACGTGKTHLAVAIAQETEGTYTTMMRLIRHIRDAWKPGCKETDQQRIDRYAALPLLVIDEVGLQSGTENERQLATEVIDGRYVAELPTVIVSNETPDGLGRILGPRVMDRLAERGKLVHFDWPSRRRKPTRPGP